MTLRYVTGSKFRPSEEEYRAARKLIPADTRDTTGVLCGDPLPGREQSVGVAHAPCPSWRSGPRMGPAINIPDPLPGQMRVQLGRGDTRMTEQLLDGAQIRAALHQVGRKAVTQHVGSQIFLETDPCKPLL